MDVLKDVFGFNVEKEKWDKQGSLPVYITSHYDISVVMLNDYRCIFISPIDEMETLPALKKHIQRIQDVDNVPVVVEVRSISPYRRQKMIENRIPFVTKKQMFLPFMGTYLTHENEEIHKVEKFTMSTQQLVLLYLYSNTNKLYVSDATKKLPYTAMTLSRAVKQLESTGLFHISKDGVNKVIMSNFSKRELFENVKCYLSSPVRKVGYLDKEYATHDMVIAGETLLAEETMLVSSKLKTYAVNVKEFNQKLLINELIDPNDQIKVELWEYNPKLFSNNDTADKLSVILSLMDNEDERVREVVEELLEGDVFD